MQLCLDVFETMLAQSSFELDRPLTGMEIEWNLVDTDYQPAMSNQHVLAGLSERGSAHLCLPERRAVTTAELGRWVTAARREEQRVLLTQATAGAGDHRNLAVEPHVVG